MHEVTLNQQLLTKIRREAKKLSRNDKNTSYVQWLGKLAAKYGFTYTALRHRVEELEQLELSNALTAEDAKWEQRLSHSRSWGNLTSTGNSVIHETLPLPISEGKVPWPNCFSLSSLFTAAEGPRRFIDSQLFTIGDSPELHYTGEELRIGDDHTLLMGLIMVAGHFPCGRLVEVSLTNLEQVFGCRLFDFGIPIEYCDVERVLWRLTNCSLKVPSIKFDGPLLSFANAEKAPHQFQIRLNPAFANFYYPWLYILEMEGTDLQF